MPAVRNILARFFDQGVNSGVRQTSRNNALACCLTPAHKQVVAAQGAKFRFDPVETRLNALKLFCDQVFHLFSIHSTGQNLYT
jgi:hypothetical protein